MVFDDLLFLLRDSENDLVTHRSFRKNKSFLVIVLQENETEYLSIFER